MPTFTSLEASYFAEFTRELLKTNISQIFASTSRPPVIIKILKPESLSSERAMKNRGKGTALQIRKAQETVKRTVPLSSIPLKYFWLASLARLAVCRPAEVRVAGLIHKTSPDNYVIWPWALIRIDELCIPENGWFIEPHEPSAWKGRAIIRYEGTEHQIPE